MRPRGPTAVMAGAVLVVGLLPLRMAASQSGGNEGQAPVLSVVCSRSLMRALNDSDAVAAAKSWVDVMARRRSLRIEARVSIGESLEQIRHMVQAGTADVVLLDSLEYLAIAPSNVLEPVGSFEFARGGSHVRYALLANAASGTNRLEDLAGKRVHFASKTGANLGRLWVEASLRDARLGRAVDHFSEVKDFPKAPAACLPVFFGTAGGCVVELNELDVMAELNPQLKTRLRQVAVSPPLLDTIIGVRVGQVSHRAVVIEALLEMHQDPQGKQILMLFRTHRIAPFDSLAMESLRALVNRPSRQGQAGLGEGRRPGPAPGGSQR